MDKSIKTSAESQRVYAYHASDEFNKRMDEVVTNIATETVDALKGNLVGLVLGGGYGRGEGGVVIRDGVEYPYNDIDFTLIVNNKNVVDWDKLHSISKKYESQIHIDVDFSRPLTISDIRNWPLWLMWFDLLNGHIVLAGAQDILTSNAPSTLKRPLPVIEAARLLLNRGAGLLWSMRILKGCEPPPDNDFVRRNFYKCVLAMGDALMITHDRFETPYTGRDIRFAELESEVSAVTEFKLNDLYFQALKFKFTPDFDKQSSGGSEDGQSYDFSKLNTIKNLAETWGKVFLYIEGLRNDKEFVTLEKYINWKAIRENDQHNSVKKLLRNILRNLQISKLSWRYPRELLFTELPVLLGLITSYTGNWSSDSEKFLNLWKRFN